MSSVPCEKNAKLRRLIEDYAETLRRDGHRLGSHGFTETEFRESGIFRGAIERLRGQFAAEMKAKREFVAEILDLLVSRSFVRSWKSSGGANRHDYLVELTSGRIAAIELKGCLDGNNTNIFERPPQANEFVIWSVCTNPGADPRHNVWSGIHARLSAEIISREQRVDGLVVWDMACGTVGRPCPKLVSGRSAPVKTATFQLPPPCIYLFPPTVPSPRNNPHPQAQKLRDVEFLAALHECFGGHDNDVSYVDFEVAHRGVDTLRKSRIVRGGVVQIESEPTPIRRA